MIITSNGQYSDKIELQAYSPNQDAYLDSIIIYKYSETRQKADTIMVTKTELADGVYTVYDTHNVQQGVFYSYKIAFSNHLGSSGFTQAKNEQAFAYLVAPVWESISKSDYEDQIELSWHSNSDAYKGYKIFVDTSNTEGAYIDSYKLLAFDSTKIKDGSQDTTYTDQQEYIAEQKIYYRLQAVGWDTVSKMSDPEYGTCKFAGVQDLQFVGPKQDTLYFRWTLPITVASNVTNDGITIYRADTIFNADSVKNMTAITPTVHKEEDYYDFLQEGLENNLLIGNLYFYRCVISVNNVKSAPSNIAFGYLDMPAVTGLSVTKGGRQVVSTFAKYQDSIVLSWDKIPSVVNDSVSYYKIFRQVLGENEAPLSFRLDNGKDSVFTDTVGNYYFGEETKKGQVYQYYLRAYYEISEDTLGQGHISTFETTISSPVGDTVIGYTYPDSVYIVDCSREDYVDSIKITYQSCEFADSILLFRKQSGGNDWKAIGKLNTSASRTTQNYFFDTDDILRAGELYIYQAKVYLQSLKNESNLDTGSSKLGEPQNLEVVYRARHEYLADKPDTSGINIKWDKEPKGNGYYIYIDTLEFPGDGSYLDTIILENQNDTTTFWTPEEFAINPEKIRKYYIAAKTFMNSSSGLIRFSQFSEPTQGWVTSKSVLSVAADYDQSQYSQGIRVTWGNLPSGYTKDEVSYYRIFQAVNTTDPDSFYTQVANAGPADTYVDIDTSKTPAGNVYFYKIKVEYNNDKTLSAFSDISNAVSTPLGDLDLDASKDSADLWIYFDTVPGITQYNLYRKQDTLPAYDAKMAYQEITASDWEELTDGRVRYKDPSAKEGKIYYYALAIEKDISIDDEEYNLVTKTGFELNSAVYGYLNSKIKVVEIDFCDRGIQLSWSDGEGNFAPGVKPASYQLRRQIKNSGSYLEAELKGVKLTKTAIDGSDDTLYTVKDVGTQVFNTGLVVDYQYVYTISGIIESDMGDVMTISSPPMQMSYFYDWEKDSAATNIHYQGSQGTYKDKIQLKFDAFIPERPSDDYDKQGITQNPITYKITRYVDGADQHELQFDEDSAVFVVQYDENTNQEIYTFTDPTENPFDWGAPVPEKKYSYDIQAWISNGEGVEFLSAMLSAQDSSYLKTEGVNLLKVENYDFNDERIGTKVVWEELTTSNYQFIVGRDTSSDFAKTNVVNPGSEPAACMDTVGSNSDILVGDTMFIDYNLIQDNSDNLESQLGKLWIGQTYYYRVAKLQTGSTTPSAWSECISIKYGVDKDDNYLITNTTDFNDLATRYNQGKITGYINILLQSDSKFFARRYSC